jgi:hypothetical protein
MTDWSQFENCDKKEAQNPLTHLHPDAIYLQQDLIH